MSRFNTLNPIKNYLLIDGETGHSLTDGISGADAMADDWDAGTEAWPAGETEFNLEPRETAS